MTAANCKKPSSFPRQKCPPGPAVSGRSELWPLAAAASSPNPKGRRATANRLRALTKERRHRKSLGLFRILCFSFSQCPFSRWQRERLHTFLWCKVARGGGGVFTTAQTWGVPAAGPKTPRSGAQTLGCSWIVTGTCTGSGPKEGTTWQGASDPAPSQPSASFPLSSGIWAALVSISPLRPWARFGGGGGGPSAIGLHWHKPNPGTRVTDKLPGREGGRETNCSVTGALCPP